MALGTLYGFGPAGAALSLVGLVGLVGCGAPTAGAVSGAANETTKKYPIQLEREYEPGKQYRVRVKDESNETMVMSNQGQVLNEEKKHEILSFAGTRKTLSPGDDPPTEYVVEELLQSLNGQSQALLPPGTRVMATARDEKWHYTVDGQPVGEVVAGALSDLLGASAGGPGDDQIFGSTTPRAVGERWEVDVANLPEEDEITFDPQGASGFTRVVALRQLDGVECLEIEAQLSLPKVSFKGLPADAKFLGASMTGNFLGLFPTDARLPSISKGMTTDMTAKMEVMSPQGPVMVDMKMHGEKTTNRD
jgi:hypothetical protein